MGFLDGMNLVEPFKQPPANRNRASRDQDPVPVRLSVSWSGSEKSPKSRIRIYFSMDFCEKNRLSDIDRMEVAIHQDKEEKIILLRPESEKKPNTYALNDYYNGQNLRGKIIEINRDRGLFKEEFRSTVCEYDVLHRQGTLHIGVKVPSHPN